jgi:hypothetical protein
MVATDWRALFGLTLSGRWLRAIEWRGSTDIVEKLAN